MIHIKELTVGDIPQCIELSEAERWNQTSEDWEFLIENTENVCLAAEIDGKIIGTATGINYENRVAWIGMVLVNRDFRGRGVSKLLLNNLLEKLKYCHSVKLDATPAGQPVYQKLRFIEEYTIQRMTNPSLNTANLSFGEVNEFEPIHSGNISEIIEYDEQIFGANRAQLMRFLVENNPGNSWVLFNGGQIEGFVLGRLGTRFYQVGPVHALDLKSSKTLIAKALELSNEKPVVVDVLNDKQELIEWLISIGFTTQRSFVRMYQNRNPFPGITGKQYLICGPEFG